MGGVVGGGGAEPNCQPLISPVPNPLSMIRTSSVHLLTVLSRQRQKGVVRVEQATKPSGGQGMSSGASSSNTSSMLSELVKQLPSKRMHRCHWLDQGADTRTGLNLISHFDVQVADDAVGSDEQVRHPGAAVGGAG